MISMEVAGLRHYSVNWAVAILMLFYVFAPNMYGGFYFILFSLTLFSALYLVLIAIKTMQFNGLLIAPGSLLFLMALLALSFAITLTLNAAFFSPIGLSEIAKPFVFMTFFIFGVISNLNYSLPEIKKTLVLVAKIIIIGQFTATIDQVFSINILSILYDYGKTSSTGDIYSFRRSSGTLYNPNIYAWILTQAAVIIFIFSRKPNRYFWLILVFLMIFLSGSKSLTVGFPVALLLVGWLKGDRVVVCRKNIYMLLILGALTLIIYNFLLKYPDVFPRLMVLLRLLSGEDASGGGRYEIWENAYAYFLSKEPGLITWLFGMGPISEFRVLDNGYLYTLFRDGIVGLILHISLLLYLLVRFYKFEDKELGGLAVQYLLMGSLIQFVVEGFAGWTYSIYLFLYAGLIFSYQYRHKLVAQSSQSNNSATI